MKLSLSRPLAAFFGPAMRREVAGKLTSALQPHRLSCPRCHPHGKQTWMIAADVEAVHCWRCGERLVTRGAA